MKLSKLFSVGNMYESFSPLSDKYVENPKRRILIDRVYITLQIPFLWSVLGNHFRKDIYEDLNHRFPQFVKRMVEKSGAKKSATFHFQIPVEMRSGKPVEEDLDGKEVASIAISMKSPHIARGYFNMNRVYLLKKGIDPYEDSFRDDNVLPIWVEEDNEGTLLKEYCRLFCERIEEFKFEYIYYLKNAFGIDVLEIARKLGKMEDLYSLVDVSVQSAEIDIEWLNCESLQFQFITDERKTNHLKVYGDLTQTEYYTSPSARNPIQWKRYQKGAGINRHEFTWNGDISRKWLVGDPEYLYHSVIHGVHQSYEHFGYNFDNLKPLQLKGESVVQTCAEWWHVSLDLAKTILFGKAYSLTFDFHTKGLRERLMANNLIEPLEKELGGKRGVYRWNDTVQGMRLFYQGVYRCECGSLMRYDPVQYRHICEKCGKIDDYSRFSIGNEQFEVIGFKSLGEVKNG